MARKSALKAVLDQHREKEEAARRRAGWHEGYEYRVNASDPRLAPTHEYCDQCQEYHNVPYEGRWVSSRRPLEIAENWAGTHGIEVTVERRKCKYHHKLGKKTVPQGTWVDIVEQTETRWEEWKTVK